MKANRPFHRRWRDRLFRLSKGPRGFRPECSPGRATNFIVLCDFVSARVAARLLPRPLAGMRAFQEQLPYELDPRPPPRHPTTIGPGERTYCFRLITNTNLTSITGPYTSRTSIVIS
jgi:hypothetical protein